MIYKLENETEEEVIIEHRYHSSIIGQKGEKIKEINSMFDQEIQITFPNASKSIFLYISPTKDHLYRCGLFLFL